MIDDLANQTTLASRPPLPELGERRRLKVARIALWSLGALALLTACVLLLRRHENAVKAAATARPTAGIAVAAAYYEDKLGARPSQMYYSGIGAGGNSTAEDFARWIDEPQLTVVDLAPRPETGAATPLGNLLTLAGVNGALAGAA